MGFFAYATRMGDPGLCADEQIGRPESVSLSMG